MGSAETPSDTQVVSQSVFDHIIQQNNDDNTLKTLHEGDPGHIDLLAGFDRTQLDTSNTSTNNTEDNENEDQGDADPSSPLEYQPNLFPESQRFITKTPATMVKQKHLEDHSQSGSPLVSFNPLASAKSTNGTMALSQMFESTQVPSSPIVNRLHSDQMSERPSPNLPIQYHSFATGALSSPTMKLAATFPQHSSESNMNYITMKESQAEREKGIQAGRVTRSAGHIYSEDQSDDDEFNKEPSFVERMKRRKMIDELANAQFAGFTAPARSASSQSRKRDGKSKSPEEQEPQGQTDGPDERHEPIVLSQNGSISEEETEQEDNDDVYLPMPRSQELNISTEENKENHNGVPASPLAAATSAHDRLSQALALQASPPPNSKMATEKPTSNRHSPNPDEQDGPGRSSQIYIVRDSQQSPTRCSQANKQRQPGNSQITLSQQQVASSDVDKQSPPPPPVSQRNSSPSLPNNRTPARTRSPAASLVQSSSQLPKIPPATDPIRAQSSNPASQPAVVHGENASNQEKSSSMPSRVVETPVHQQSRSFADVVPGTTVPETSPHYLPDQGLGSDINGDAAAQEDDDLPPVYPSDHDLASQSRPLAPPSSSTVTKGFNSRILSSPSGRQRRALTEIASEASPGGPANFDIDFGIFTADDREFRSMVAMSPNPPRKKRRGNDGHNIYASDPILPVTPLPTTPRFVPFQEHEPIPEEPQPDMQQGAPGTAIRKRSEPSNRADTVWDVDASPKCHVSHTGRRSFFRSRLQQPARDQEPEENTPDPPKETTKAPLGVDDEMGVISTRAGTSSRSAETLKVAIAQNATIQDITIQDTRAQKEPTPVGPSSPGGSQIAHNQVLAPWSGPKRAYYPATCLGTPFGTSASKYLVKFEDSLPVEVPTTTVKRLELRVGDAVKVELPKFPKIPHVIRGFEDRISEEDFSNTISNGFIPMTDVYGNLSVILEPKARKSISNEALPQTENVKVPISRIYLDTILWNQLKDRSFGHDANAKTLEERPQTPALTGVLATPTPPSSRLSRTMRYMGGIFAGMVFAVSYVDDDAGKMRVSQLIMEHGGRIIDGFNELFEFPSNVPLATPTTQQSTHPTQNKNIRLTRSAEDLGFACVIADKHSRREKYMQALALNLPCLSGRWVEDCIAQNRILDWEMYLLPAGDSTYLNGAAKSRILTPTLAVNARFSHTIAARPKLLDGQSVLIVMGRGKEEEKSRAYIFLTYALGASRVERVYDLKSANTFLDQESKAGHDGSWDWVYVHFHDQETVRAEFLQSTDTESNSGRGTKRRKVSHFMGCITGQELGLSSNITVVGNDFVCQSLILGRLFEA